MCEKKKQAINKELTELLGECAHEWETHDDIDGLGVVSYTSCKKCQTSILGTTRNDFFTNEGYGKLRDVYDEWGEDEQQRFMRFIYSTVHKNYPSEQILHTFHRDNLAPLMLEFLKQEG